MLIKKSLLAVILFPLLANAQVQKLTDSAQRAILTNPEVLAKWHAFQAANGERDVAYGGYLPHVDIQAAVSREDHNEPLLVDNYNSRSQSLTLSQMLYDGFATRNDVARLDHNRLERLYELYDISESTTLDVVHAHLDVLRYRKLVALAEDNYVQHRAVYDQIQTKAKAGVGRRVDFEQAAGRLALAEANLLTETSNLHDVSARYQRLVGEPPAKEMDEPNNLDKDLPPDVLSALKISNSTHPTILAAIENIRAADSEESAHKGVYQPRFDLRLSAQHGNNINSEIGETNDKTAQIVMSWNLFNGLSDRAKLHQLADQLNVTRDLRDKACRDVRQNLEIAYNDKHKIAELLTYLDQHQLSIEKARDAYHQQFDIGQRTLLDLLDSENELFQAKRSYIEAEYDQLLAFARVHAGVGDLFKTLGLSRPDAGPLPNFGERTDEMEASNCPVEAPQTYTVDKTELNERAKELMISTVPPPDNIKSPTLSKDSISFAGKAAPRSSTAGDQKAIADALSAWSSAWSSRDVKTYLHAYATDFQPEAGISHENWAIKRSARINGEKQIDLGIGNIRYDIKDGAHASTTFHQTYHGGTYHDEVEKRLDWEKRDGRWIITNETTVGL